MIFTAISKSGLTIRLPEERWQHIIEGHPELADQQTNILHTIENPDRILEGDRDGQQVTGDLAWFEVA